MATVIMAIGAGISSAATAVTGLFAGAGGAAAGGAAASTGAAAGSMATISNVLSAGSALAAIGQGFAANAQAKDQAAFANTQAEQEKAAGASAARDLAREYNELRSEQTAIQLANGLNIGIGTPASVGEATKRQADRDVSVTRQNARNRSQISRLRSRGLLSEGRAAMMGGFGRAASIGANAYQLTG